MILVINMRKYFIYFALLLAATQGFAQTIVEKKAGFTDQSQDMNPEMHKFLLEVNRELRHSQEELAKLYAQVRDLYARGAEPEAYQHLLSRIK